LSNKKLTMLALDSILWQRSENLSRLELSKVGCSKSVQENS